MSEKRTLPHGVYTALVTPFRDGEVDRDAWDRLVSRQVDAGVAGLVPVGCTGEAAALTLAPSASGWCAACVEICGRPLRRGRGHRHERHARRPWS